MREMFKDGNKSRTDKGETLCSFKANNANSVNDPELKGETSHVRMCV